MDEQTQAAESCSQNSYQKIVQVLKTKISFHATFLFNRKLPWISGKLLQLVNTCGYGLNAAKYSFFIWFGQRTSLLLSGFGRNSTSSHAISSMMHQQEALCCYWQVRLVAKKCNWCRGLVQSPAQPLFIRGLPFPNIFWIAVSPPD